MDGMADHIMMHEEPPSAATEGGAQYAAYLEDNRAEPERKVVGLSGTPTAHSTVEVSHETL